MLYTTDDLHVDDIAGLNCAHVDTDATLFTRILFHRPLLTSEQEKLAKHLDNCSQARCAKKLSEQDLLKHLSDECSPLIEMLTDIIEGNLQNESHLARQKEIDISRLEMALEKLAPFLRPELAEKCVAFLALDLQG